VNTYLKENPDTIDPKKYNKAGIDEVKKFVMEKIQVCGCQNKA
ncbi:tagatose-bisphosphate aldolase subunit KbaY, partial [Clostridium saudiense]|nr:tagatose-bisphosphate aldolase subunit KbaY [Clostridium saudiense]